MHTDRVKKEIDRYSFEASEYLLYDSANKKVVRKLPKLPDAMGRARLSADGNYWLSSNDGDLQFLEARTFKELGKIDLSTPRFFGAGAIRLSGTDLLDDRDPDPVLDRVGRVVELELGDHRRMGVGQAVQPDQRGPADQSGDVVVDA